MVWNDEFNGTTLDASKWKVPPAWNRQDGSYWSADNYQMTGNGQLKLSVTEKNGKVYCGALRTHNLFDKKYGFFEVRCKVPQMQGGWAAFWMMPYQNKPGNAGNDGTEIDIFESINGWKGEINHALHWDGYGAEHMKEAKKMKRPDLYDDNYHVFSVMWTPKEYIFYIDNKETWRTSTAGVSDVKQYLKLTLEVSGYTWPGDWKKQKIKTIHWLIDYVRVYDYEPISEENVNLEFTSLTNNQNFNVGDQVQMHTDITGTLSQLDELKFFTKKGNEPYLLSRTSKVNTTENNYAYNWFPNESGNYNLKVSGYKNGTYVTNVTTNITVKSNSTPLSFSFKSLNSGTNYKVEDAINMDVQLVGELSDADQIQYLTKKDDGDFVVRKTQNLTGASAYNFSFNPTEAGNYSLRITALKNGKYFTHVVVSDISVEEILTPLSMISTSIISENNYKVGNTINLGVKLSGDFSDANAIQFLVKKDNGEFVVQKTQNLTVSSDYNYNWTATESGNYSFRVTALINSQYVTHVLLGDVTVDEILTPLSMSFTSVKSGDIYQASTQIPVSIKLSGDLSDADEVQFLVREGDAAFTVQHTLRVSEALNYNYNWTPSKSGIYSLRVTAKKNGSYVTHAVIGGVEIESNLDLAYTLLQEGSKFKVGDKVKMSVKLLGDYSKADQLKFVVQKIGETGKVVRTSNIRGNQSAYGYKWTAQAGKYTLKVVAFLKGVMIANVRANITVENPLKFKFRFLKNGQSFAVGSKVRMHFRALGSLHKADQIKFVVQKAGGTNQVVRSYTVNTAKKSYGNTWIPKEAGSYKLKAEGYKNGVFVTIAVANIKVTNTRSFQSRAYTSNEADESISIEVSVYPNPSVGLVNVDLGALTDTQIKVSNSSGQMIYQEFGISGIYKFELKGVPGLYFMEVKSESGSQFFKLIKK